MADPEDIQRQFMELQRELAKTEEALARLRKKISESEKAAKPAGSSKSGRRRS